LRARIAAPFNGGADREAPLEYGISIATAADSWKMAKRAEEVGFARAGFFDTHLLNAELFAAMGAACTATAKIRLATHVLIPSNRIAPVAASGLATLNALAPGRIEFGISTGFTARRTMGLSRVKLSDVKEYVRIVQGLLADQTLEWTFEGKRRKIRFLNPEIGAINLEDPIPLYISSIGPRARDLAAELGAGWICPVGNPQLAERAMADMKSRWRAAGRDPKNLRSIAEISGCVLADGEPYDSARAKDEAGPTVMMLLHDAVENEQFGSAHGAPPPPLVAALERYREVYRRFEPADARYLVNHRGHLMFLKPEERDICTGELIRGFTWTATRRELQDRVRALRDLGFGLVTVQVRHGRPRMIEDWAEVFSGV
jgi:5,10-methylenetetrahydromethanopterin reductase